MSVYFDDLVEGMTYTSQRRTVTEADIVNFAGLSGDFNPLHTDETWVRAHTDFKGRIAHGLLVLSMCSGLRTPGIDDWLILAYLGVERQMAAPTYPGDTLTQMYTVTSLRRSKSNPDTGVVIVGAEVTNQDGVPVQHGTDTYLVAAKSGDKQ